MSDSTSRGAGLRSWLGQAARRIGIQRPKTTRQMYADRAALRQRQREVVADLKANRARLLATIAGQAA